MRFIVVGVGAIGGVIAGALVESGHDVVGVARGARHDAIREKGLLFRTSQKARIVRFPCVTSPQAIDIRKDDLVLLCVKCQDTISALEELRSAKVHEQPIFCAQNGVANERMALRMFPNVHGINVMMPADYLNADDVVGYGSPSYGIFDIGRYPAGVDDADHVVSEIMNACGIATFVSTDVMRSKYGKLIQNLGNISEAALGRSPDSRKIADCLRDEARQILVDAGISWIEVGPSDPRRETLMQFSPVPGAERVGNSSIQSLLRGATRLETDFLNGEIVLTARLNGSLAPANEFACAVAVEMARLRLQPGSFPFDRFARGIGL